MQYVIYDTNEYVRMVGTPNRPFEQIRESVERLHKSERRLSLLPILNTTVAYELIKHLASNNQEELDLYIRACYALAIHCGHSFPIMTKNPTAAYIEEKLHTSVAKVEYVTKFLQAVYNNPTQQTVNSNIVLINKIAQYQANFQADYLQSMQQLQPQFRTQAEQRRWMLKMIDTKEYLPYRSVTFLESVVQTLPLIQIDMPTESIIRPSEIKKLINEHRTYMEIWRGHDRVAANLSPISNANTFWDAEICYHLGTFMNGHKIYVVTEEKRLHQAAENAHQSNLMLYINQIFELNKMRFILRNLWAWLQRLWWMIIEPLKK